MRFVLAGVMMLAGPASAAVVSASDGAFVIEATAASTAPPATVWKTLGQPARWWAKEHSWSGDVANFSLDLKPGGCFCEALPGGGGVEHGRVIYADPGKLLRISGAFGPMQAEAVAGTLSITITPAGTGSTVTFRYAAAGGLPLAGGKLAPMVDGVLGEQVRSLAAAAGR